jgi:hypothetical protein
MKKSEMIEHISAVMYDAYVDRQHSRETEDAYWNRHAAQLLDMMLGLVCFLQPGTLRVSRL